MSLPITNNTRDQIKKSNLFPAVWTWSKPAHWNKGAVCILEQPSMCQLLWHLLWTEHLPPSRPFKSGSVSRTMEVTSAFAGIRRLFSTDHLLRHPTHQHQWCPGPLWLTHPFIMMFEIEPGHRNYTRKNKQWHYGVSYRWLSLSSCTKPFLWRAFHTGSEASPSGHSKNNTL